MVARTIVVGDVHGCLDELRELLRTVEHRPGTDRLVLIGDLVDRGPDSRGVIREAMRLGAECVMGNHDEKHVRHARKMALSPDSRVGFRTEEERGFYATLSPDELTWLSSLPDYIRLGPSLVAVHAGCLPDRPVEAQPQRALHRCRYVERVTVKNKNFRLDKDGKYNPGRKDSEYIEVWEMARMRIVETERGNGFLRPRGSIWWTERWNGADSIVYGHNVFDAPRLSEPMEPTGIFCLGIDTGACFGMTLTAAVWTDVSTGPDLAPPYPELVSIESGFTCDDDRFYEGEYDPDTKEEIT